MMRWRRARVAAHRLFSAEFARKDRQPRNKISRLGVCQPLHCAQIEPLDSVEKTRTFPAGAAGAGAKNRNFLRARAGAGARN